MCLAISSPTVGTLRKTHDIALISGLDTPTSITSILDGIKTQSSVLTRNRRKETLLKLYYVPNHHKHYLLNLLLLKQGALREGPLRAHYITKEG